MNEGKRLSEENKGLKTQIAEFQSIIASLKETVETQTGVIDELKRQNQEFMDARERVYTLCRQFKATNK
jgi:predicted RNase H-like nuclease (RuvC/YqgF family)